MSKYKNNHKNNPSSSAIGSDFRIKIEKEIENFVHYSNDMCFEFPPTLTNVERAFVHKLAPKYNLKTKSEGFDENRRLKLFKPTENDDFTSNRATISLDPKTMFILKQFSKESSSPQVDQNFPSRQPAKKKNSKPMVLSKAPHVPMPSNADQRIIEKRMQLSIYSYRDQILKSIEENKILLIQGSTGSGKTTQIPQFILENATEKNLPCRILCTQPRRISAIASSERVCYERCEYDGRSIGYQIRLESTISQDTNCIFLTPGVFLRYLTSDEPERLFNNITHILIDEAHERAKENDFLLTSIKEHLNVNPNLRLIIMSATMDTAVFSNYFGGCEEIAISVKQYNVQEFYLEDVLKVVKYNSRAVEELNEKFKNGQLTASSTSEYLKEEDEETYVDLDEDTLKFVNEVLNDMSTGENTENDLEQFLYLVEAENVPVDFRHGATKMTALMIAIGRSCFPAVERLLKLNANPNLKVHWNGSEISCLDIAIQLHGPESDVKKLVEKYKAKRGSNILSTSELYNKELLNIYYNSVFKTSNNNFVIEEGIDHDLIVDLIETIHLQTDPNEAILVFLPGYDDITRMAALVSTRLKDGITMFLLHSSMKTDDQKSVFKPVNYGSRKIILSTNIAESSITIDDVVYVIDSGREKQKSYDAMSHSSSLRVQWISKASANQRKGRAGRLRNGYVYRVYSSDRFNSMPDTTLPELLRTSLTEICLQTKLMISMTMKIEDFLLKCITPPSLASIRQSIKLLQSLGALDEDEGLTQLGNYLAQMPVDAKYGKMLIYAISLKCLDPVLSIVSILSMSDQVFVLPVRKFDREKCQQIRMRLTEGTMSDHYFMLKIFQLWQNQMSQNRGKAKKFCEENFISSTAFEHVKGIRGQIMSYLQKSDLMNSSSNGINVNSNNWPMIKACLCAGLYPSVARIDRKKKLIYSDIDVKLCFHMSSAMSSKNDKNIDFKNLPSDWVVFEEKNRVGRIPMIRCNTLVNSLSLSLAAGASLKTILEQSYHDSNSEESVFKIDNLVTFSAQVECGSLLLNLRRHLDAMITKFVSQCNFKHNERDEKLVEIIGKILEIEEKNSGFVEANLEANTNASSYQGNQRQQSNRNFASQGNYDQSGNRQKSFGQSGNYQRSYDQSGYQGNYADQQRTSNKSNGFQSNNSNGYQTNKSNGYQNNHKPMNDNHRSNKPAPTTFFANNAGFSGYSSTSSQNQVRNNRPKYFVMKMNSDEDVTKFAQKMLFDLEELRLQKFVIDKLQKQIHNGTQVLIIFYSTVRSEFLGFGDVMPPNSQSKIQFHFRVLKKLPLTCITQEAAFRCFNIFEKPNQVLEDLSDEVAKKIITMLRS